MDHVEEYKQRGTIHAWSEEDAANHENTFIRLALKDAKGLASVREKIALRIDSLCAYNNVEHIPDEEIFEATDKILEIINSDS